jgi:hypothetical protein
LSTIHHLFSFVVSQFLHSITHIMDGPSTSTRMTPKREPSSSTESAISSVTLYIWKNSGPIVVCKASDRWAGACTGATWQYNRWLKGCAERQSSCC